MCRNRKQVTKIYNNLYKYVAQPIKLDRISSFKHWRDMTFNQLEDFIFSAVISSLSVEQLLNFLLGKH